MDEIELLIFQKLVETNQLRYFVKGWTVWLEFPEVDLHLTWDRGQVTTVWGMKNMRNAPGVKVEKVEQF